MEIEETQIVDTNANSELSPESIEIDPEEILQQVTENLVHNIPIQAVDLLLEADMIENLVDMKEVDSTNVWKICQYLMRIVHFHYEQNEKDKIYNTTYSLFCRFHMWTDRLVCAIAMNRKAYIVDSFNQCDDDLAKKQMCEIISKCRLSQLIPTDNQSTYSLILSSSSLSDWYMTLAKELDLAVPRLPDSVLSLPRDPRDFSSERKQSALAIVNGLINTAHCNESYFRDETGKWTDGFEKNKGVGLTLAACGLGCIFMWSPYEGMNNIMGLMGHPSQDVRIGAHYAVGLINNGICNPHEDITLNALYSQLTTPLTVHSSQVVASLYAASLYSLAMTYAGTSREDIVPFLMTALESGPDEAFSAAAIASGLIFCGTPHEQLVRALKSRIECVTTDTEESLSSLMIGFGWCMMYMGTQRSWNDMTEIQDILSKLPDRYQKYLQVAFLGVSYLGSQNILVIHQLLEMLGVEEERIAKEKKEETVTKEKKETPNPLSKLGALSSLFGPKTPTPAEEKEKESEGREYHLKMLVLALTLVSAGETTNTGMMTRTLELLLVYGNKSVTEVVLLALALVNVSNPSVTVVDQVMRKTAGGGETNLTNSSAYRSCVNAVISLGIIGSGSCNSKINTHFKQVVEAEKLYQSITAGPLHADKAFFIHFSQGLVHLGRGLITLSPVHTDGQLFNPISLLFIMSSLLPRLCPVTKIDQKTVMLMLLLLGSARPRCMMIVDGKHENANLKKSVRVGQAVDTTGQVGSVRNISGFQTMDTPVILSPGERAVVVSGEDLRVTTRYLEGFVFGEEK